MLIKKLWIALNILVLMAVLLFINRISFGQDILTVLFFVWIILINIFFVYLKGKRYYALSVIWIISWMSFFMFILFPSGFSVVFVSNPFLKFALVFIIFLYPFLIDLAYSFLLKKKSRKIPIFLLSFIALLSLVFSNLTVVAQYSSFEEDIGYLESYLDGIDGLEEMSDRDKLILLTMRVHEQLDFRKGKITSATEILKREYGTCSSHSIVMKELSTLLGYPSRIVMLGLKHVVTEVYFDNKWNLLDAQVGAFYLLEDGSLANALDIHYNRELIEEKYRSRYDEIFIVDGSYKKVTKENEKIFYGD